jgi:hypothetical protein
MWRLTCTARHFVGQHEAVKHAQVPRSDWLLLLHRQQQFRPSSEAVPEQSLITLQLARNPGICQHQPILHLLPGS